MQKDTIKFGVNDLVYGRRNDLFRIVEFGTKLQSVRKMGAEWPGPEYILHARVRLMTLRVANEATNQAMAVIELFSN